MDKPADTKPAPKPCLCSPEEVRALRMAYIRWESAERALAEIIIAANLLKTSPKYSISGYGMERAVYKHKPELLTAHKNNLAAWMEQHGVALPEVGAKE